MRLLPFLCVAGLGGAVLLATACSSKVTGTGPGGSSSGSSGTSGTSGTSGKTSGSSGTSGTSSGTSGTSGIGTSGASGTSGTSGTSVCGFTSDTPGCNTCLIAKCCSQAKRCNASAECNALFECIKPCGSSDSCITTCQNRFSVQASDDLASFFDCITNSCTTQCN